MQLFYEISVWFLPVIVAITFHEAAHGFVAHLLGDDTAWRLGRVSFNPLKHIDPFGTIVLPGMLLLLQSPFLFGYAKPVPVNFQALRNPFVHSRAHQPENQVDENQPDTDVQYSRIPHRSSIAGTRSVYSKQLRQ